MGPELVVPVGVVGAEGAELDLGVLLLVATHVDFELELPFGLLWSRAFRLW